MQHMNSKNIIQKNLLVGLLILTFSLLVLMPFKTFALIPDGGTDGNDTENEGGDLIIENPLSPYSDIWQLIMRIIDIAFNITIFVTAILIVYAGFVYITAGGQEEKIKTAQKTLTWAIIGLAIVILAKAIPPLIYELITGQKLPEYSNPSIEFPSEGYYSEGYYFSNNASGFNSSNIYPTSPVQGGVVYNASTDSCSWDDNALGDDSICTNDLLL